MARHNIYVSDDVEQLLDELKLVEPGWSALFQAALSSHLATLPETKVRRALGRITRRHAAERVEQLLPARVD